MECIIVFDNLNDLMFAKYNLKFSKHLKKIGLAQGLISPDGSVQDLQENAFIDTSLYKNVLIQIFAPLVTSQRVMTGQFCNPYTSIQCRNGTNLVFDEYMGFLFFILGSEPVMSLQRSLCVFLSFVKHVCGADVTELKRSNRSRELLNRLFDTWRDLRSNDQAFLVEASEQLCVNPDLTGTAINALRSACISLRSLHPTECSKSHALVFVRSKLLALYTSREAEDLAPSDILFLNIFANSYGEPGGNNDSSSQGNNKEKNERNNSSEVKTKNSSESTDVTKMASQLLMLKVKKAYVPHAVHYANFGNGLKFLIVHQICHEKICIAFDEVFDALTYFGKGIGFDADLLSQKRAFEDIDRAMKKVFDCFKKIKNKDEIEPQLKQLYSKWDHIKKRYGECVKNNDDIGMACSGNISIVLDYMRHFYQSMVLTTSTALPVSLDSAIKLLEKTHLPLIDFADFLKTRADHNFTLKSRAVLSINKYLEEFPGLVHFLYIDRINHRVTAPFLQYSSEETNSLIRKKTFEMVEWSRDHIRDGYVTLMWQDDYYFYSYFLWFENQSGTALKPKVNSADVFKTLPAPNILAGDFYGDLIKKCFPKKSNKIWEMVEWTRDHIRDGHLTFMWKDTAFNYSYFLWFEDLSSNPLKPKINLLNVLKTLPMPGILAGDFYKSLIDACFPKISSKVRCFELYCIHLGLATSSTVLDQSRRIAATIWEVTGPEIKNPNLENIVKI